MYAISQWPVSSERNCRDRYHQNIYTRAIFFHYCQSSLRIIKFTVVSDYNKDTSGIDGRDQIVLKQTSCTMRRYQKACKTFSFYCLSHFIAFSTVLFSRRRILLETKISQRSY